MGYLNSLPGFCIRGENYNALAHLCAAYRSARDTRGQIAKKSMQVVHPWYGADLVDLEKMRKSIRETFVGTFVNPPAGTRVVGCKEIRINRNDMVDFDGFLETLQEVFGDDVKIIFNHRDVTATSQSAWWKDTAHAYATIKAMDQRLRTSRFTDAANVFHVEYEELIKGPDHARDLAAFLGVPFDPEAYDGVMSTRHSY